MAELINLKLHKAQQLDQHLGRLNRALFLATRAAEKGNVLRMERIERIIRPDAEWLDRFYPGSKYEIVLYGKEEV